MPLPTLFKGFVMQVIKIIAVMLGVFLITDIFVGGSYCKKNREHLTLAIKKIIGVRQ